MTRFLIVATVLLATAAHAGDLPDPSMTPGALDPSAVSNLTVSELCPVAHTPMLRNVPDALKRRIYAEYGMVPFQGSCAAPDADGKPLGCEIDHLCSLELGCTNSPKNLWPQPYGGTIWNAHVKDRYENFLHAQVCTGKMTLRAAQLEISTDWIAGYKSHPALPQPGVTDR